MTLRKVAKRQAAARSEQPRNNPSGRSDRTEHSRDAPPLPKASRREGIPQKGALPHGEERARPKDSGRHGA